MDLINKGAIEFRVVQFWPEIILVISDQIALHSVQLPLCIADRSVYVYNVAYLMSLQPYKINCI